MADYPEGTLREDLALYDLDPEEDFLVEEAIERILRVLDDPGDYGPLRGLSRGQSIYIPALGHFGYWILASREPRAAALDLAQRIKFLMMSAE
ncbi:hypothetical protein, partial [Jannaschia pohangensis]